MPCVCDTCSNDIIVASHRKRNDSDSEERSGEASARKPRRVSVVQMAWRAPEPMTVSQSPRCAESTTGEQTNSWCKKRLPPEKQHKQAASCMRIDTKWRHVDMLEANPDTACASALGMADMKREPVEKGRACRKRCARGGDVEDAGTVKVLKVSR